MSRILCSNCKTDYMQEPSDHHPSYVECPTCGAILLTYIPQEYQAEFHATPYELNPEDGSIKNQTIGLFGGRKSVASDKTHLKFRETLRV